MTDLKFIKDLEVDEQFFMLDDEHETVYQVTQKKVETPYTRITYFVVDASSRREWEFVKMSLTTVMPVPEVEESEDPEYDAWVTEQERLCDTGFTIGSRFDPTHVSCLKDREFHWDPDNKNMHVGEFALGPRSPGEEPNYVRWTGGGSCAGDPLPRKDEQFEIYFDNQAYQEYVDLRRQEKEDMA
jgi:hypothetical protein